MFPNRVCSAPVGAFFFLGGGGVWSKSSLKESLRASQNGLSVGELRFSFALPMANIVLVSISFLYSQVLTQNSALLVVIILFLTVEFCSNFSLILTDVSMCSSVLGVFLLHSLSVHAAAAR